MGQISRAARGLACLPIRFYQSCVSPCLLPCCRFYPTCSDYAISAIQIYGIARGSWLAVKRLLRCQPWSSPGFDPVLPLKKENT